MLVNNAGAAWRGRFAETGWANIERHMKLDFEAPVRLTEALLPLLRATAAQRAATPARWRSSTSPAPPAASRAPTPAPTRPAKFALAGWSDALHAEEREHGVHVGLVLPGLRPHRGLPGRRAAGQGRSPAGWSPSPEAVAEAIMEAGPGGRAERYVPRYYWIAAALRILAPRLIRRATAGGGVRHRHQGRRLSPAAPTRGVPAGYLHHRSHLSYGRRNYD